MQELDFIDLLDPTLKKILEDFEIQCNKMGFSEDTGEEFIENEDEYKKVKTRLIRYLNKKLNGVNGEEIKKL